MNKKSQKEKNAALIKAEAKRLGFSECGIAKARFLEEEADFLEEWLKNGMHGEMSYMANHFDKRLDPTKLVEGAKSVVMLSYNYFPEKDVASEDTYKVAKYAYGEDYHYVIKRKLKDLVKYIESEIGEVNGRVFVDSAPVMERAWAKQAGLGWVGKHSLLLNRSMGSFFFLAELIIDLELEEDPPIKDYCGTCTRCIDACPTDAIPQKGVVDGSKCISYLTIELKDSIPQEFEGKMQDWIFGCDICQDVCPWNRFSKPHQEECFNAHEKLGDINKKDWEELTEDVFKEVFRKSAVKRTKYEGLMRNINFAKKR
ncbi:tRNA epoxyqueuosine(34) reductase QueG [Flammeovirga sp. MY04]|uniref:tRNA epoxyqueuosine(34) reductase QueG n=1 Tax=Flammeovirga sp. MY04 TaxID=1191459 RepID=UPI00080615C3|nr:tRNA epoxyqueuosine(34) reductase QueG [Flammeovirga sp. MY04]ANQ50594.1 tRNA epoxyqueuosine(34) reductase QueG [Flammeovirga sp. MY04]